MNDNEISMKKHDFWCLRSAHEQLAIKSFDVREIVLCAKVRMDHISTGVTSGGRAKQLAYEGDTEHMYTALRLLEAAKEAENMIINLNT